MPSKPEDDPFIDPDEYPPDTPFFERYRVMIKVAAAFIAAAVVIMLVRQFLA